MSRPFSRKDARKRAWEQLSDFSFSDLERFIETAEQKRQQLTGKLSELYDSHPGATVAIWEGEDVDVEAGSGFRAFTQESNELLWRMKTLSVRLNVAEDLHRRMLYGEQIPPYEEIAEPEGGTTPFPSNQYERRIWALMKTEKTVPVEEWIENAQFLLSRALSTDRGRMPKPESVQRTVRDKLKDLYSFDRLSADKLEELVQMEAERLDLVKVEPEVEKWN
jgi:hypothetical protein